MKLLGTSIRPAETPVLSPAPFRTARSSVRLPGLRAASIVIALLIAVAHSGCSSKKEDRIPEIPNRDRESTMRRPVTEVRQTQNVSAPEVLNKLGESLQRRQIRFRATGDGAVESEWLPTQDSMCSYLRDERAPLTCRVRLFAQIDAISSISSAIAIRYEELCDLNGDVRLECPDSSGEKLLLGVASDLKVLTK